MKMMHESEFDQEKYISLKGLVNHHNGEYKSSKQGRFIKKQAEGFKYKNYQAYNFIDYEISEDEFLVITQAAINYDPDKGTHHRGYRIFYFVFILDNFGVNKLFKVTCGYENNNGRKSFPARSFELVWEREEVKYNNNINTVKESTSKHVGNIGDTLEKELTLDFRTTFETEGYHGGTTLKSLFKFKDNDGNIYAWFTTASRDWRKGKNLKAKFTVKKHDTYRGDKQTIVKRLKEVN